MKRISVLLSFCAAAAVMLCGCGNSGSTTTVINDSAADNGASGADATENAEATAADDGENEDSVFYGYKSFEFDLHAGDKTYKLDLGEIDMLPPYYDVYNDKIYVFCESLDGKASVAVIPPEDPENREIIELPDCPVKFNDVDPPLMQAENTIVGMTLGMTLYKYNWAEGSYSEAEIQGGWGMATDKEGNIYVLCNGQDGKKNIQKFDADLKPVYTADVTAEETFVDYINVDENDELAVYHYNIEEDRMDCDVIDKETGKTAETRENVIFDPEAHLKTSDGIEIWLEADAK